MMIVNSYYVKKMMKFVLKGGYTIHCVISLFSFWSAKKKNCAMWEVFLKATLYDFTTQGPEVPQKNRVRRNFVFK